MKNSKCVIIQLVFLVGFLVMTRGIIFADTATDLNLIVGDLQTINVKGLSRVSVTNPDIADISDAKADKVSILANNMHHHRCFPVGIP